ncbi:VRR-NUC domain-containing protein (plasmid) [Deinococcus radiomollis]|uniref:VRR-NUC domain-containing protein n=1 Tax=Deinococcus radiomollis TaxID=468916 RepID=UPI003892245F
MTAPNEATLIVEGYWMEHGHQVRVVNWCDFETPAAFRLKAKQIYANSNGYHRSPAVAAKLKADGVRKGIPDLHLAVATGRDHGLYIEMKNPGGRPSAEQSSWSAWRSCRIWRNAQCSTPS